MNYSATYEIKGRTYGMGQGLTGKWFWESGDDARGRFDSLDEAIRDAKLDATVKSLMPRQSA